MAQSILLTGDDGYRSLGIRLMVKLLKDDYSLKIAATKEQSSAIGGAVTHGGQWGRETVSGVKAIWVSGTPSDAVECAELAFEENFDLVISGLNTGANVGSGNASGTIGAALRALSRGTVDKAIALSWVTPPSMWHRESDGDGIEKLVDYPGNAIKALVQKAQEEQFWGADLLNFNFPEEPTNSVIFAKPIKNDMRDYYHFDIILNKDSGEYTHKLKEPRYPEFPKNSDAWAINNGHISCTPWLSNLYLNEDLLNLIGTQITI